MKDPDADSSRVFYYGWQPTVGGAVRPGALPPHPPGAPQRGSSRRRQRRHVDQLMDVGVIADGTTPLLLRTLMSVPGDGDAGAVEGGCCDDGLTTPVADDIRRRSASMGEKTYTGMTELVLRACESRSFDRGPLGPSAAVEPSLSQQHQPAAAESQSPTGGGRRRKTINLATTELKRNKNSSSVSGQPHDRILRQQNQHSSSCPTLVRSGMLAVTPPPQQQQPPPAVGAASVSSVAAPSSDLNDSSDAGACHRSMLNLISDALVTSSLPPDSDSCGVWSAEGKSSRQSMMSNTSTPSTSVDAGVVQICINDVSVSGPDGSDLEEDCVCLETVKRQRRRLSWCPEDDRKREDKEEKQKMLGIGGRSQSLSSLDGDDDATDDSDVCDEAHMESPNGSPESSQNFKLENESPPRNGSGTVTNHGMSRCHIGQDIPSEIISTDSKSKFLAESRHHDSLMDDESSGLDIGHSAGLQPGLHSPQRDRSRSVIELVSEPNMVEQLESVMRKFKAKEEKPSRRDSVFSKISSYRQKWLNERNSKSFRNTHQFVPVSFSNSTACDVCSKPLLNKAALQCENCAVNVHESSCKDQNILCPRYSKNVLSNSQSLKDRKTTSSPNFMNLRGTQSMRETSSGSWLLQVQSTDEPSSPVGRNSPGTAGSVGDERQPSYDEVDGIMQHFSSVCEPLDEVDLDDGDDPDLLPKDKEPEAWSVTVDIKTLKRMNNKDIKRQDHIWELIQTEKNHYRTLKIMQKVFAQNMLNHVGIPRNVIDQMFPSLETLLDIHRTLLRSFVKRQRSRPDHSIDELGDLLIQQFDGQLGNRMKRAYGEFCSRHMEALNVYKDLLKTDRKFQNFVNKCSRNILCKRLGIPECILLVTQRVTKYPLLIEPIIKTTKETNVRDREQLRQSLSLIQDILKFINRQVASREKELQLAEICKRLDQKSFTMYKGEKFKKSDLQANKRKLHHAGFIKWMSARGKTADVLTVILSDVMFFLSENNQKYTFFSQDNKSCIISLSKLIVREKGDTRDSKGIYLICPSKADAEMYELVCQSMEERKYWISVIREAITKYAQEELMGSVIDSDEEQLLHEAQSAKLSQLIDELHEKDHQIRSSCDEKMRILLEMLELLAQKNNTWTKSNSIEEDTHSLKSPSDILRAIMQQETNFIQSFQLTDAKHCCNSADTSRSCNNTLSISLPKRAETFNGFEGRAKSIVVVRRRHGSGYSETDGRSSRRGSLQDVGAEGPLDTNQLSVAKMPRRASIGLVPAPADSVNNNMVATTRRLSVSLEPVDSSMMDDVETASAFETAAESSCPGCAMLRTKQCESLSRLLRHVHLLVNMATQKTSEVECLRAQLTEAKATISRLGGDVERKPGYHHNQQLEELRALQAAVHQEKAELSQARQQQKDEYLQQQEKIQQEKNEVDKWKVEMKSQKDELQRQRDALQRQIDLFEEQRRNSCLSGEHRSGSPFASELRRSESPSTSNRCTKLPLQLNDTTKQNTEASGCGENVNCTGIRQIDRHLSPVHSQSVDGRALARVGSAGSLNVRNDSKRLPLHLLSTTNESRLGHTAAGSSTAADARSSIPVHQIIPTKLSKLADCSTKNEPAVTSSAPEQLNARLVERSKVGGHLPVQMSHSQPSMRLLNDTGTRSSTSNIPVTGNILPMKLAESSARLQQPAPQTVTRSSDDVLFSSEVGPVSSASPSGVSAKSSPVAKKAVTTVTEVIYF